MRPLVSVVMPTYNGERFIAAALESVRRQHDDGIELVIVDDGSTDDTLDIVRRFAEVMPIRLVTPGRIGNWVAATNLGLREAVGHWACLLHQDDLWLPGRLKRLRSFMESDARHRSQSYRKVGYLPNEFIERLLVQNFIAIPSPMSGCSQLRRLGSS